MLRYTLILAMLCFTFFSCKPKIIVDPPAPDSTQQPLTQINGKRLFEGWKIKTLNTRGQDSSWVDTMTLVFNAISADKIVLQYHRFIPQLNSIDVRSDTLTKKAPFNNSNCSSCVRYEYIYVNGGSRYILNFIYDTNTDRVKSYNHTSGIKSGSFHYSQTDYVLWQK